MAKNPAGVQVLTVSPGLHRSTSFTEMEKMVRERGKVIPHTNSLGYMYYSILTDNLDELKEHLKSLGMHSDGSYGSDYF